HVGDGAGDVFAAVYEVAEQDECVPPRVAREQREQLPELRAAAVNVADDEGTHRHPPREKGGRVTGKGEGDDESPSGFLSSCGRRTLPLCPLPFTPGYCWRAPARSRCGASARRSAGLRP